MKITLEASANSIENIIVLFSADRYICSVALANCIDYFRAVQCVNENVNPIIPKGRELEVFCRYLTAIESLNNIPDYLYYDKFRDSFISDKIFRTKLLKRHSSLKNIADIANAYKHCIRHDHDKTNAKSIQWNHDILSAAFKFWMRYYQSEGAIDIFAEEEVAKQ